MKRLLSFALIAALPAAALSLKDWEAKPDQQQRDYISECLIRLTAIVRKTDPALERQIGDYYSNLRNSRYPEGMLDVLQRIGQLQGRAERGDRSVDLSKVQVEDIILQNTSAKFSLPASVTAAAIAAPSVAPAPLPPPAKPAAPEPPPARPAPPAPTPAPKTIPTPERDPIGPGGFIGPPIYQIRDHKRDWIGRTMIVEGTVSKVDLEPDFVGIYFKDAPDGRFQVFSPLSAELRARYGANLSGLIGRKIRVDGLVQDFEDTDGGIRFTDMAKLTVVP